MEKMHYNKQCNDLIQSEISAQTITSSTPSITAKETGSEINGNSERILSVEVNNTKNGNKTKEHEASDDIGTHTGTSTSCTSSTDSGVNISDNDEIPHSPSPTSSHLHSFPSTISSSSETTTVNPFNKQFHKNNKQILNNNNKIRDNNINNKKANNNYNNNHIFNGHNDNYDDDDDDKYNHNNSTTSDNKLKSEEHRKRLQEQQFLKAENSSNGDINTRYQQNQNVIESENVINVSHQRNLQNPTTRVTPTTTNYTPSLQHNEFINPPQRSPSTSSSLSMSSIMSTNSDDKIQNPPSKMHHCSGSPVVSIRSINSTIITSDSDSDSDLSGDTEGVHANYVIKKLGTQVTYPPKHPDIPNINSGHTVLNQQVVPDCNDVTASPLAALAAIGDRIGAAQALGPVPSLSAVPQRPQIGSIALSNSSDVTFGDKHFYEGPVTIQQFLIDGRDKWKETNGKENPTFVNDTGEPSNNAKDINSSGEKSGKLYGYISKRKKLIIPSVLALMTLLIVATILGSKALSDSKTLDNVGGGYVLRIVPRVSWLAQPPINKWVPLDQPIDRVIVIPTRTSECDTQASCMYTVRITQTFNIESQQQDDIIYNFLIGGDGNVYEGRGWDNRGSVIKGFNDDSISLAYIGSFKKQSPSYKQLNVTKLLLEDGVRKKKLSSNYKIVGANKLDPTSVATIADALYKSFENWPHWSDN
ncbi:peptidoglycan-recognition protein LC-like isoform X4 [Calliphora vicina]|uniref:peptidoglycan-recognition protein LC-like isoform X4 n=1 Tax=Calliphora vicina TaxID=7373 RepID=UPI00325B5CE5